MYDGKPEKRKFSVWATKVIKYKKFAIFYNQDKCDKIRFFILIIVFKKIRKIAIKGELNSELVTLYVPMI